MSSSYCSSSSQSKHKRPANNTIGVHICDGECIQLFAEACPGSTFKWEPSAHLSADNVPNPVASPPETTCYTVLIKNADKKFECRTQFVVTVHPSPRLACPPKPLVLCMGQKLPVGAALEKGSACSDTLTYHWEPALGLDDPTALNPNAVWAAYPCPEPDATTKEKIIYFDSFDRAPELLDGSVPDIVDVSVANAKWTAPTSFAPLPPQIHQNQGTLTGQFSFAYLPFQPQPGKVYTLCVNADTADFPSNQNTALYFGSESSGLISVAIGQRGAEDANGNELYTLFAQTLTPEDAYPIGYVSKGKLQLILDTTDAVSWTILFQYANDFDGLRTIRRVDNVLPFVIGSAGVISGVGENGFPGLPTLSSIDNFKLTCAERTDVQKFFYTLTATSPEGCVDEKEYCVVVRQDMPPVPCINAYRVAEFNVYNDLKNDSRNTDGAGEVEVLGEALLTNTFEKVLGTDPDNALSPSLGALPFPAADTIFTDPVLEQKVFAKQKPLDRHFISFRAKDNKRKPIYICEGEAIVLCGGLAVDCRQTSMCLCSEEDVDGITDPDVDAAERERLKKVIGGLLYRWSVVGGGSLGTDPFTGLPVDRTKQCILVAPERSTLYQLEIEDSCTGCRAQMDAFLSVVVKHLPVLHLKAPTKLAEPNKIFVCRPRDNYKHLVLEREPLVYYQFNERQDQAQTPPGSGIVLARDCTALNDKYKRPNNGVYRGAVLREQPSKSAALGCAICLDGATAYVETPPGALGDGTLECVSIELWFKLNTLLGRQTFFSTTGPNANEEGLILTNLGNTLLVNYLESPFAASVGNAVAINEWFHVVGVVKTAPRQLQLYLNGELVDEQTPGVLPDTVIDNVVGNIGRRLAGTGGTPPDGYVNGCVDDFALYPFALDADTVAEHYRAGCRGTSADNPPPCLAVCVAAEPPVGRNGHYEWFGKWEDREAPPRGTPSVTPCDYFLKEPLEDRLDAPTANFAQLIDLDKLYADFDKKQDDGAIKAYNYIYCIEVCCPVDPREPAAGGCPAQFCFQVYASNDVAPSAVIMYVPGTGALDPLTCQPPAKVGPLRVGRDEVCIVCDRLPTQFCTANAPEDLGALEFAWHPPQYFDDPTSPYPTLYVNGAGAHAGAVPPLESGDKVSVKVCSRKTHCCSTGACTLEVRPTPCAEVAHDKRKLFGCVGMASKDVLFVKPCLLPKTPVTIDDYCVRVDKVWAKCALTVDDLVLKKQKSNAGGVILEVCVRAIADPCKIGVHRVTVVPQSFGFHDDTVSVESPSFADNGCSGAPLTFDVCVLPDADLGTIKLCFSGCDAFQLLNIDYEPFFPAKAFDLVADFDWKWSGACPPPSSSIISPSVLVDASVPIVNPHVPHPIITLQTLMANAGEKCGVFCLWLTATHRASLCEFELDVIVTVSDRAVKLVPKVSYVCKKSGRAIVTNVNSVPNLATEWSITPFCNDPKADTRLSVGPLPANASATVSGGVKNCTYELLAQVKDVASDGTECECVCSSDTALVHFVDAEPETCPPTLHFRLQWCTLIRSEADGDNADVGTYVLCVPLKGFRGDLSYYESRVHPITVDADDVDVKKAIVYDEAEENLYVFVALPEGRQTIAYQFAIDWEGFFVCAPKAEKIAGTLVITAPNNPESFRPCKDVLKFTNLPNTFCLDHDDD